MKWIDGRVEITGNPTPSSQATSMTASQISMRWTDGRLCVRRAVEM